MYIELIGNGAQKFQLYFNNRPLNLQNYFEDIGAS